MNALYSGPRSFLAFSFHVFRLFQLYIRSLFSNSFPHNWSILLDFYSLNTRWVLEPRNIYNWNCLITESSISSLRIKRIKRVFFFLVWTKNIRRWTRLLLFRSHTRVWIKDTIHTANEIKNSCHSLFSFESRFNEQIENFFGTKYSITWNIREYFTSFHNAYLFTRKMFSCKEEMRGTYFVDVNISLSKCSLLVKLFWSKYVGGHRFNPF